MPRYRRRLHGNARRADPGRVHNLWVKNTLARPLPGCVTWCGKPGTTMRGKVATGQSMRTRLGNYGDSALFSFLCRPRFRGLTAWPTCTAIRSRNPWPPTGRPMLSAFRSAPNAATSVSTRSNRPADDGSRSCIGLRSVTPSGSPVRCARALDQGQSAANSTNPARTGFSPT